MDEPDPNTFSTDGPSCVVQGRPVVVHSRHITLVLRDGDDDVVIGRVKAEFDLSEVPDEFRMMVVASLASSGQTWMVGAVAQRHDYLVLERIPRRPTPPPTADDPSSDSWWGRLFRRFR